MKTRITIIIAVTAIATLSFTFVTKKAATKEERSLTTVSVDSTPGGFALEDEL
jgi:hypothetical protein